MITHYPKDITAILTTEVGEDYICGLTKQQYDRMKKKHGDKLRKK